MFQISDFNLKHIEIILNVLNKYDPIGIIILIADNKEYEVEAIDIGIRANVLTLDYLTSHIEEVLYFWFHEHISKKLCLDMAKEIKEQIEQ